MLLTTITTTVPSVRGVDAERDEEGNLDTRVRAAFGRGACDVGTPDAGVGSDEEDAIDTITNVLHFVDQTVAKSAHDVDRIIDIARRHFERERWNR